MVSNPIRLRLDLNKLNKTKFSKNKFFKKSWTSTISWIDCLNFKQEVTIFNQSQLHIKNTWDSMFKTLPGDLFYQNALLLKFFLEKFIYLSFYQAGFFVFQRSFVFEKNQLLIQIHIYPFKKVSLDTYESRVQSLVQKVLHFIQHYSCLKCKIVIFDHFTLLNQHKLDLQFRREQAENFQLVNISKNFKKQQLIFQCVNVFFLIKSAKFLVELLAFELSQSKKQHLLCLNLVQKSIESFWILQQLIGKTSLKNDTSFFRKTLLGLRIQVKGRLNRQDRKQKYNFTIGRLALQELSTGVDFAQAESFGLSGVLGIKVWVSFQSSKKFLKKKLKSTVQNKQKHLFKKPPTVQLQLEP